MRNGASEMQTLVALGAGCVGGVAIATTWKLTVTGDTWTALSAMGTFTAAGVALGIAVYESRQRRRTDLVRATLVAATLYQPLGWVIGKVNMVLQSLAEAQGSDLYYVDIPRMRSTLEEIKYRPSREHLSDLAPLPNECAVHLAEGFAQLDTVLEMMAAFHAQPQFIPGERTNARDDSLRQLHGTLSPVETLLKAVMFECQHARFRSVVYR